MLTPDERSTSTGVFSGFASCVDRRALVDLGFVGARFTWSHGVEVEMRKLARLERDVCYDIWWWVFPLPSSSI